MWDGRAILWKGIRSHQTPDDLISLNEFLWAATPSQVVEVGPGEGGTTLFLRCLDACPVVSVDHGERIIQEPRSMVILDGDVYSKDSMLHDLNLYSEKADWMVVCHTDRLDWGSAPALAEWLPQHPEWVEKTMSRPTLHTWLARSGLR